MEVAPSDNLGIKDDAMQTYPVETERMMERFFQWLSEKDRRRYAAVEAAKLGHGGVEYVARVLGCDPQTIQQGREELEQPEDPAAGRVRKKATARTKAKTSLCSVVRGTPGAGGGPSWIGLGA